MRIHFYLFASYALFLLLANQSFAQDNSLGATANPEAKARRQPIREVTLTGTGYELGLQHGQIFKKEIGELIAMFKENTTRAVEKDANEVIADFYQKTSFDAAIKQWTPDLYEEVRGIADGAGQPFNDVMVFSLLDEFWVYQNNIKNHHCSGVGVPARDGKPGYIAQNMDIEAYTDGYQVLLRIARHGDRPEQLILTHPGCIALNGMNETGIGACMNTLMQLKANTTGLPVAFIVRRMLSTTDKNDLLAFIQNVPHASGQNYIIGIREEVYDFEASANKVVRFDPKNENGTVWHTNHPLVNDDLKPWFKKFDPTLKPEEKPVNSNSFVRLAAVQRRLTPSGAITDAAIMEALRSKDDAKSPVCVTPNQWGLTFGSVIMTLTGKPFLQITAGPPDESEYVRVEFSEGFTKDSPVALATQKPRARDIGIPFNGTTGKFNSITDVKGVEVGYSTIISGEGKNIRGKGPVRTGVTAILPRGMTNNPVFANWYSLNGNGEMTGTTWITESGFLEGPIMITNTNSVGVVRDAVLKWYVKTGWYKEDFWYTYPVVAETYDGFLNDIYGFHVKEENAYEALESAKSGFIKEGNVGGGTGMMCLGFKGGTGTASRIVKIGDSTFTVGALVQSNFGSKRHFAIAGVPIGQELKDTLNYEFKAPPSYQPGDGSIIVVVATDAPLLPHQLKRIAARVPLGIGIMGGRGENGSGDIFIAFSTANPSAFQRENFTKIDALPNDLINPLFDATVQAVEEAIINAMVAAETMQGINGNKAYALPHQLVTDLLNNGS